MQSTGTPAHRHGTPLRHAVQGARGADDLRTGAWRSRETLWFLLPYAVARDRGTVVNTPLPFDALDAHTRTALWWMHRTIVSGDAGLDFMADASEGEGPQTGTGMILAGEIYPFQSCPGYLYMDWTMPEPLPTGPNPVSRFCPCDTALSLFQSAWNHANGRRKETLTQHRELAVALAGVGSDRVRR